MGKAALGKGMKDLIAKNFGLEKKEGPEDNETEAEAELLVNIERYQAQGLNVEPLKKFKGKKPDKIMKGISDYRSSVKDLNSAQTVLRTLEGYGYTKEIETINENIKDPSKAEQVSKWVEELRDRVHTEHNVGHDKRGEPGRKLSRSLKEKSKKLKKNVVKESGPITVDENALDDLLDDLIEIGDAYSLEIEEDPLLSRISNWEEMGYFVDKLKNSIAEDRDGAQREVDQFEVDIKRMEKVKELFKDMDLTGFQQEAREMTVKFQYPHLAQDVENQLLRIRDIQKKADTLMEEVSEKTPEEIPPQDEEIPPADEDQDETELPLDTKPADEISEEETSGEIPEEEVPQEQEDIPEAEEVPLQQEDIPIAEEAPQQQEDIPEAEEVPLQQEDIPIAEEAPQVKEEIPEAEELKEHEAEEKLEEAPIADEEPSNLSGHSPDELMELAKDAYKEGRMEEALTLFKELLILDPNSSKAIFMIRRITSKMGQ